MRAAIYVRISSDRRGLEAGVDRQREDCAQRAQERGWDVVAVETDNDMSASTGKRRPGFEALLRAIEDQRVDVVIAWSLDRLQRRRADEVRLYEACKTAGTTLALVNGAELDFSTAAGRFVADSLGSVARLEVELKSDRQKRATLQAAQAGRRTGGRRPFGYDDDGTAVRGDEAQAIREGYRDFLAGVSLGAIARSWNEAGFRTGQARWKGEHAGEPGLWRRDNLRVVLSNPRYAGLRAHLGEVVAAATWPALVDEDTWRAASAILSDPSRRRAPRSARALLSGIAICGVCGETVHGGGGRANYRTIRCRTNRHFSRQAELVEDFVEAYVVERLGASDAAELMSRPEAVDLEALRTQAVALRTRQDSLAVDFAEGDLTPSQIRTASARIREKLALIDAQLADAGRVDVLGPIIGADDVAATWGSRTMDQKRAVIDLLYTVRIFPVGRGRGGQVAGSIAMLPR